MAHPHQSPTCCLSCHAHAVSIPEPAIPKTPIPPVPRETETQPIEKVKPIERVKPIETPKKDDIIEKVEKPGKKTERLIKEKKESLKHLQEDLEEIRKKIALDEIQKRVARKEQTREEQEEERPAAPLLTPRKFLHQNLQNLRRT